MADKYNAEGYFSPTEHEAFTRLEKEEKAVRKAAAFRPIVYICSPYSGDTERNIKNAKRYSRFAVNKNMRSDTVTKGKQQAPHRSLFNALGMTQEEMDRPLVGIVSSYNEIVPGHMNLDKIVNAVKQGVAMAGGTPVVFPAIAVCDGIAMGHIGMKYSLVTRDLIADSTEAMAMAHQFDVASAGAFRRSFATASISLMRFS